MTLSKSTSQRLHSQPLYWVLGFQHMNLCVCVCVFGWRVGTQFSLKHKSRINKSTYFSLIVWAFCGIAKKSLPNPDQEDLPQCFLLRQSSSTFLAPWISSWKTTFHRLGWGKRWFGDGSSALHLLCSYFQSNDATDLTGCTHPQSRGWGPLF